MGELLKKLCKEKDIEVNSTMSETKAAFSESNSMLKSYNIWLL